MQIEGLIGCLKPVEHLTFLGVEIMDITTDRFLKPSEVCAMLRIGRTTLWSLRKSGKFPASIKIGNAERFTVADIEKLIVPKKS